ncbi:MAG TPA: efflux RND transporter periplasmic adaptor subunit [Patescibacteria group bacterium]|nr:efflux RND transporter periplasmic adaptor subunit [Patescibacteria group bacterium]
MKKLFNKQTLRYLVVTIFVVIIGIFSVTFLAHAASSPKTETVNVNPISQQILATGSIAAQTQAVLNFQMGGKLIYLPFKEGDAISQGQTIAQLDTYALQKQLQIVANTYQASQNTTGQVQENQNAGVLEGQQRTTLDQTNKQGYSAVPEAQVIYDAVKRLVDNANLAQNSAQLSVDLANYSLQLTTLTSPINGIVLHEDVNTTGVSITPVTSFVVADPTSMVFSANVRQQEIAFISVGNPVTVSLDAISGQTLQGVVDKIYPQKTTLTNGDQVYRVDVKINNLPSSVKLGQSGTVLIKSNFNQSVILVPSWTVLSDTYVWVLENGKPVLKKVTTGDTVNGQTEVMSGLLDSDKVITNPQSIISKLYSII